MKRSLSTPSSKIPDTSVAGCNFMFRGARALASLPCTYTTLYSRCVAGVVGVFVCIVIIDRCDFAASVFATREEVLRSRLFRTFEALLRVANAEARNRLRCPPVARQLTSHTVQIDVEHYLTRFSCKQIPDGILYVADVPPLVIGHPVCSSPPMHACLPYALCTTCVFILHTHSFYPSVRLWLSVSH